MDGKQDIMELLRSVADGSVSPEDALNELKSARSRISDMQKSTVTAPCARAPAR